MQRSIKAGTGRWGRLAAAAGVGAVMALGMSGVAAAAPVTGKVVSHPRITFLVNKAAGVPHDKAILTVDWITFKQDDGDNVLAYCVDLHNVIGDERDVYTEASAAESEVAGLDAVRALLAHSLPAKSPADVAAAAGLTKPEGFSDKDFAEAIYAGTQAAIWRAVDPKNFDLATYEDLEKAAAGAHGKAAKADLKIDFHKWLKGYKVLSQVYRYLHKVAGKPSLTIDPASANANVGEKTEPFTVKSHGVGDTELTASAGGTVVDEADGKFKVKCGDTAGTVTITGKAKYKVPHVKVHKGEKAKSDHPSGYGRKPPKKLQAIITVHAVWKELTATATVTCRSNTTESGGLPVTGAPVIGTLAAGLALVSTGAGLFLVRRRRIQFTA